MWSRTVSINIGVKLQDVGIKSVDEDIVSINIGLTVLDVGITSVDKDHVHQYGGYSMGRGH